MAFRVTFTSPKGITLNLNDGLNTFIPVGFGNELMPPFAFQESTSPLIPGSVISAIRVQPRSLSVPLMVYDEDWNTALARARGIMKYLNPSDGDGVLSVNFDDDPNQGRILYCRYKDGLLSDGNNEQQFSNYVKAILTFYAADPYWYPPSPTLLYSQNPVSLTDFFPIFPIRLMSSTTNTTATLNNAGDVPAWPVITITGPGTRFIVTNHTTNKVIDCVATLLAGETMTIDTRPRTRGVRDGYSVNRFSTLTATSAMFPLEVGDNFVELQINGGTAATQIVLSYSPPYLSV